MCVLGGYSADAYSRFVAATILSVCVFVLDLCFCGVFFSFRCNLAVYLRELMLYAAMCMYHMTSPLGVI